MMIANVSAIEGNELGQPGLPQELAEPSHTSLLHCGRISFLASRSEAILDEAARDIRERFWGEIRGDCGRSRISGAPGNLFVR